MRTILFQNNYRHPPQLRSPWQEMVFSVSALEFELLTFSVSQGCVTMGAARFLDRGAVGEVFWALFCLGLFRRLRKLQ